MKNLRKRWMIWLGLSLVLGLVLVCLVLQLSKRKLPVTDPSPGKIAFVREVYEIYVMESDGSNSVRLTDHDDAWGPSWSPDGTHLAFVSDRDGNQEIYVMKSDGSDQVNVSNHLAKDDFSTWSPDSARVVFKSFVSQAYHRSDLYVVDRDGSHLIHLSDQLGFDDDDFAWSPDGTLIAFESRGEIYVVDRDGSNLVNLTDSPASDGNFAWSPDGNRIAFTSNRGGRDGVYVMNSDGSDPTFLMSGEFDSWSPDGSRIYFWNDGLYVMNNDGLDPVLISRDAQPGLWSPDHAYLAYVVEKPIFIDWSQYSLFIMRSDGSRRVRLVHDGIPIGRYDWSPDGQYLVYSKYPGHSGDASEAIFISSVDGRRELRLTYDNGIHPVWQPCVP